MFGTFSTIVENEHKEIGTDYDVDRIRTHGITIGKFKSGNVFPLYAVFTRFDKYFVNESKYKRGHNIGKSVVRYRSNRNLGSVTDCISLMPIMETKRLILERHRH